MARHLHDYLHQRDTWMSKAGAFPIQEMDDTYRRRAAKWLTKHASELFRLWTVEAYVDGEEAPDLDTLIAWVDNRPSYWIKGLPLYQALTDGLPVELVQ